MSLIVKFLLIFISIESVLSQENFLVKLDFKIREERVPAIINYLLNNSLEEHDITTQDIIKLSKLDQINLEETINVIGYFNVTTEEAFTVDHLQTLLEAVNLSFGDFYSDLTKNLDVSSKVSSILGDLEVPVLDFLLAVSSKNDVGAYNALRQGKYDSDHVNAALATAEKTPQDVYTSSREIILQKVTPLPSKEFMEILKNHGWDRRTAVQLYRALNLTTRDVYEVEKFRVIFTNISDTINQNVTLGVFVGPKSLAIHEAAYNQTFNMIDGVTFKVEAGGVEIEAHKKQNLGDSIVELAAKDSRSGYINIVDLYNETSDNCYLLTVNNNAIKVDVDENFTIAKPSNYDFLLGSPLVCDDLLYGLAREEDSSRIKFDIFYTEDNPEPEHPPEDFYNHGRNLLSPALLILVVNIFITFLLL